MSGSARDWVRAHGEGYWSTQCPDRCKLRMKNTPKLLTPEGRPWCSSLIDRGAWWRDTWFNQKKTPNEFPEFLVATKNERMQRKFPLFQQFPWTEEMARWVFPSYRSAFQHLGRCPKCSAHEATHWITKPWRLQPPWVRRTKNSNRFQNHIKTP